MNRYGLRGQPCLIPEPTTPSAFSPIEEVVSNVGSLYMPCMILRALADMPNLSSATSIELWSMESKACFQSKNM